MIYLGVCYLANYAIDVSTPLAYSAPDGASRNVDILEIAPIPFE